MDTHTPPDGRSASAAGEAPPRRLTVTITPKSIWPVAALVVGILLAVLLVSRAMSILVLLLISIILGEAIRPLVNRLERRRIPGPVATLLIYVVVFAAFGVLVWLLVDPLVREASSLATNLPDYLTRLRQFATDLQRQVQSQVGLSNAINSLVGSLAGALQQAVPSLLAVPIGVLSGILGVFIDLVVVLTMTLFWLMSSQRLKPFVVGLFPPEKRERAESVISEVGKSFGGYVRGTIISMVLIGLMTGLGLFILGVPYAVLLGVVAGLSELLPYLGPWISGPIAVLVALVAVDPLKAIEVAILFVLIQQIEGNVVQPLVMSRQVHVDPLLVIVSVLTGIALLGVVGAILAVPIAAGIQVVLVRVVAPAIRARYGETELPEPEREAVPATPQPPSEKPAPA